MVTAQMTLAAAWVIERPSGWFSLAGQPGQTALTRMPSRASSAASSRVSALSAALDTLYAGEPPVITEIEPPSLLTLTIRGRVLERSIGSSASITRQGPNRLTSIASATVPRSALLAVAHRSYMVDALFTSTSLRPNRFFTHSAMLATLTELSTSSWQATIRIPSGSSSFAAGAAVSLAASWLLVSRLERLGERAGFSEAWLGLVAALAADAPEITSAVTALARGQASVGAGVVIGSNVFNLAALLGLAALVAGSIGFHRRVVVLSGVPAVWLAAVCVLTVAAVVTPVAGLGLAAVVRVPYVAVL